MTDAPELPETWPEPPVMFVGPCTCTHSTEQHGWGACLVDGCDCDAHWEAP